MKRLNIQILTSVLLLLLGSGVSAERIKDLVDVAGVRSNQLLGYGLVVGLVGTGDQTSQTPFTVQSLRSMLNQLGISLPTNINPQLKNVAAATVSASLPAFIKPGQSIDVTVTSIGNAKSLRGGTLLMTPLKGADGEIYALAQGNLVVGGFGAEGGDGSRITVNIPSAGRIPNGATVEREVSSSFADGDYLTLNLRNSDFTTAYRLADAINNKIGPGSAKPFDATSIRVSAPRDPSQRVSFLALIEAIDVIPGDTAAKVIVNSRTGTVVIGENVRVRPVAISHGNMTVTISENQQVSQPAPLSGGETTPLAQSDLAIEEGGNRMFKFAPGVSLDEIVEAVNRVGAAPGDLMAILEALKEAGALRAELIVI